MSTSLQAPAPMRDLAQAFDRLPMVSQVLVCGATCTLLVGWAAHLLLDLPAPALLAVLAAGALCTGAGAALARRVAQALDAVAQAARHLLRDASPEQPGMPSLQVSREVERTSQTLRRLQEATRQRIQGLETRNAQLGSALKSRTQELSSLQDLSIGLAQEGDISALVNEALGALEQTVEFSSASIWARQGLEPRQPVALLGYRCNDEDMNRLAVSDLAGLRLSRANLSRYEQIEADGQPIIENQNRQGLLSWLWSLVIDDARTSALYRGTRAWMAVPLKVRGSVLGVLRVDHGEPGHFDEPRVKLLTAVGSQAALAMRHAHMLARERDLAVVTERNRIARELHDAVSQTLFAANLMASTLVRSAADLPELQRQAQLLEKLNRSALAEMRMLLFELRPDALEESRLVELLQQAIEALAGRGEIEVSAQLDPQDDPPARLRVPLYRIAQEALSNIARHSGARHAQVRWAVLGPGQGRLQITDDGHGFDTTVHRPGHFGLGNMRDRAQDLGARLVISSSPEGGTDIQLDLSWEAR